MDDLSCHEYYDMINMIHTAILALMLKPFGNSQSYAAGPWAEEAVGQANPEHRHHGDEHPGLSQDRNVGERLGRLSFLQPFKGRKNTGSGLGVQ